MNGQLYMAMAVGKKKEGDTMSWGCSPKEVGVGGVLHSEMK